MRLSLIAKVATMAALSLAAATLTEAAPTKKPAVVDVLVVGARNLLAFEPPPLAVRARQQRAAVSGEGVRHAHWSGLR